MPAKHHFSLPNETRDRGGGGWKSKFVPSCGWPTLSMQRGFTLTNLTCVYITHYFPCVLLSYFFPFIIPLISLLIRFHTNHSLPYLSFTKRLKNWRGRQNSHPFMLTISFHHLCTLLHFQYIPRPFLHYFHLFTLTFHMQNSIKFHIGRSGGIKTRPPHLFFLGRRGGI